MKSQLLAANGRKTWALVFDQGDEVVAGLEGFATEHNLSAGSFQAIGAFQKTVLGYFQWDRKDYKRITLDEQAEVLSLLGDVSLRDGKPAVHAHAVLGRADGTAWGGHLLEGHVRPTLEVLLTETPGHLRRSYDPRSGLALIRP